MWAILQSKKGLVTISDFLTLCEKPPPQRKLIQVGGTDHEDHFKCFKNASEMLDYLGVDVQKVSCFFGLWCVCVCVCVRVRVCVCVCVVCWYFISILCICSSFLS